MKFTAAAVVLSACFATPAPVETSSPDIEAQQRAAFAQSMGHPTKKSRDDLEDKIREQTRDFTSTSQRGYGRLESPPLVTINGVQGICYTVVMRLREGAAWGLGAEAGLRFDFESPTGRGSGGPGVHGPGAVVSVGCAEASGPITLTMTPMIGKDPIGTGPFEYELWSHVLTRDEAAHLETDKQRQVQEQRDFAAREEAKRQQRASTGCAKCDGRYQGCIGAGKAASACQSEYRSCAFREVGADYVSACPNPSY